VSQGDFIFVGIELELYFIVISVAAVTEELEEHIAAFSREG
jgi:hypothetical protein